MLIVMFFVLVSIIILAYISLLNKISIVASSIDNLSKQSGSKIGELKFRIRDLEEHAAEQLTSKD